jgi:hypothetical protein
VSKYESPTYDLLTVDGEIEIRQYFNFYIVEYDNENDPAISNGFGSLFRYISSDNKANEKISMTIPVIEEITEDKKKMAFVVPKKFGDRIPEPNNPALNIKPFAEGLFGVIRYSGLSNASKEAKIQEKLNIWLKEKGYKIESNFMLAFYNAPFIPPFLRRNEVWVRVSKID